MNNEKKYLRFTKKQILIHWLFAGSFFVLAFTGISVIFPGLAWLTADGVSGILHRVAAITLMSSVVLYYVIERARFKQLIKESFSYDKDDIKWIFKMFNYFLGKTKEMPPSGRLNGGEKLHHMLIIITFITISVSGMFLWFGKGSISSTVFLLMIWVHNLSMFLMLMLTIGHLYFTFVYGALPHMISGYTTESYAKKHIKWLRELKKSEAEGI